MRLLFTALACLISVIVVGQCEGDCINGFGKYTFKNEIYEGMWMGGEMHGLGRLEKNDTI